MKFAIFALALVLTSAAYAKDVTITLTDQEQQALAGLLDLAVKQGGLRAATPAAVIAQKIQKASPPPAPTTTSADPKSTPQPKP